MLNKLYCFVLIIFITTVSAQEFQKVNSETYPPLKDIFFINDNTGWIVSDRDFATKLPVILKTTDGGVTWFQQNHDVFDKFLYSVFFIDENRGYVGGSGDLLLSTTDGGDTWVSSTVGSSGGSVKDIYFANESTGWLRLSKSSNAQILYTNDGGTTWKEVLKVSKDLYSMSFAGLNVGVAAGKSKDDMYYTTDGVTWSLGESENYGDYIYTKTNCNALYMVTENFVYGVGWGSASAGLQPSILIKSTNGGKTWKYLDQSDENKVYANINDMYFENGLSGICFGGGAQYGSVALRTTDGGKKWIPIETPFGFNIYATAKAGNKLFIVGAGGNIAYTTDMGISWTNITPMPEATLYSITFPGGNSGYAAGFDGLLVKTYDGGQTWIPQYVAVNKSCPKIENIFFVDENVGYIGRAYGMIVKTTDGGDSWSVLREAGMSSFENYYALNFLDADFGYIAGRIDKDIDIIFKTTDGGTTFTEKSNNFQESIYGIHIIDKNNAVFAGDDLLLAYTEDGAESFKRANITGASHTDSTTAVDFIDFIGQTGLAVGQNMIFKSEDGGKNWNKSLFDSVDIAFEGILMISDQIYYVIGDKIIYHSIDGGATWTDVTNSEEIDEYLRAIAINESSNTIWLSGNGSSIYKADCPYPPTSIKLVSSEVPESFNLDQNYPNPFNPMTKINYNITESGFVELNVFTLTGELAAKLINKVQKAGSYSVNFNAENLVSGIYFYTLSSNKKITTKKMVLLK